MASTTSFFLERDTPGWSAAWNGLWLSTRLRFGIGDITAYNAEYREVWQYMGSIRRTGRPDEHQFRHRMHPISGQREYISTVGIHPHEGPTALQEFAGLLPFPAQQ